MSSLLDPRQQQPQEPQKWPTPIEELWWTFRAHAISEDASEVQLRQMKKAFIAGMWTMLSMAWNPPPGMTSQRQRLELNDYLIQLGRKLEAIEKNTGVG